MYVDYQHNQLSDDGAVQSSIRETLPFDDADLAMNKAGKLSTPQMTRLVFTGLGPFLGLVGTAAGLVTLALGLWMAGPTIATHFRMMLWLGKYLIIGVGALFFGVVALIMKLLFASGRVFLLIMDLMAGNATSLSGRMNTSNSEEIEDGLSTFTRQKTYKWSCVIKGEYFEINEEAFRVLQDCSGSNYKAYVTPKSRYLVAIEPTGPDPNARDPFKLEYKTGN